MHAGAYMGNEEIVEMLILAGAPINKAAKKHGETPLHIACRNEHEVIYFIVYQWEYIWVFEPQY